LPKEKQDEYRSWVADDKRFNGDDQPVVGVSWRGAKAYCDWLSKGQVASGKEKVFRLPKEEEWEWAASGGKREYPWGNEAPDKTRANYGSQVGHTTPAGAYPAGATPEGLMDMAGNVWEWMENLYEKAGEARALRGGSWSYTTGHLRCAARYHDHPVDLWDGVGFRVVCAASHRF
jgi:formylglycine-generating enzyme required for sulfatase activity